MCNDDNSCEYDLAWVGKCKNPASADTKRCETHSEVKCCVCGALATHQCPETSSLVCGYPLCNDCEHEIDERGTNGGGHHVKKCDQKHKPWYVTEAYKVTAKNINDMLMSDSDFKIEESALIEALQSDFETSKCLPTLIECNVLVMGEEFGVIPENLKRKFPATNALIEKNF